MATLLWEEKIGQKPISGEMMTVILHVRLEAKVFGVPYMLQLPLHEASTHAADGVRNHRPLQARCS